MIPVDDLLKIQRLGKKGILVIRRKDLSSLIQEQIGVRFSVKLLNAAIALYCSRGRTLRMNPDKYKKYNIISEKVPGFLSWFFDNYTEDFYNELCDLKTKRAIAGSQHYKKRLKKDRQLMTDTDLKSLLDKVTS